jgi:hypothetical protein
MPKVRVNDIEMYYEIHGNGTPLVINSTTTGRHSDDDKA